MKLLVSARKNDEGEGLFTESRATQMLEQWNPGAACVCVCVYLFICFLLRS